MQAVIPGTSGRKRTKGIRRATGQQERTMLRHMVARLPRGTELGCCIPTEIGYQTT